MRYEPHDPAPGALQVLLGTPEDAILPMAQEALTGVHATDLPRHLGHPLDDFDILWRADGGATVNIRLWRELAPPFRHAVVVLDLAFEDGEVAEVAAARRRSFGA